MTRAVAAALAWLVFSQVPAHRPDADTPDGRPVPPVERRAYVMGTRVHLAAFSADRDTALARLEAALVALEDAEQELSTWRPDSQISAFNRSSIGTAWRASRRLCRMFVDVFEWQQASDGAFDPAVGALIGVWKIHEGGRVPSGADLAAAMARSGSKWIDFNPEACTLTRRRDVTLDVGAFGKGEGLDRAAVALGGGDWMIDLGGQVSVSGSPADGQPWTIDLADPLDRQRPVARVLVRSGSVSTSGASERDLQVDGRRIGHLLDPRSGEPARFTGSVVVWHERALVADILSTALYVMGPGEGLRWAADRGLHAAYLIPRDGRVVIAATSGMTRWLQPAPTTTVLVEPRGDGSLEP